MLTRRQILVNGQRLSDEAIRLETERLSLDPNLAAITDEHERSAKVRDAAENSLTCRTLVEQMAVADPRPLDADLIAKEIEKRRTLGACRSAFDEGRLRQGVEMELRVNRTLADLIAGASRPQEEDIRAFYAAHGHNFQSPEMFHAAHIVKHVNEHQSQEQAEAGIREALSALESGDHFASVADRFSDCKGNGGDLGCFPSGTMVQEFEDMLRTLQPGDRSGIFATPFGFHIAELRARQPGGRATFDAVRTDIERVMNLMAEHQAFTTAVERLLAQADIRVIIDGVDGAPALAP